MKRSKRLEFDIYILTLLMYSNSRNLFDVLCCKIVLHVKLMENGALYFFTYPSIIWPYTKINKSLKSRKSRNKSCLTIPIGLK